MKKLLLIVFPLFLLLSYLPAQNGTCIPPIGLDCVTFPAYIDSVWTTNAVINFSNDASGCNAQDQNYQDYASRIVYENGNDNFDLHIGLNPVHPAFIGVWIDWNRDLVFGSGEQVYLSGSMIAHADVTVNVPNTPDTVIMRVRCGNVAMGPCDSITAGETEDYRVVIYSDALGMQANHRDDAWFFHVDNAGAQLIVESTRPGNDGDFVLMDITGKILTQGTTSGVKSVIDISGLAHGMYIIRYQAQPGIISSKKFIR